MTKQVDEGLSGRNNVEIESKLPCEKSVEEQLEVMEEYTRVHKATHGMPKGIREIQCMKVFSQSIIYVQEIKCNYYFDLWLSVM